MINYPQQFKWSEIISTDSPTPEFVYVIAEQTESGWQFYTRGAWDLRWFPAESSDDRIMKAETLKRQFAVDGIGATHTLSTTPGGRIAPAQAPDDRSFHGAKSPATQRQAIKGWQHPTVVVISLALLASGGIAISLGGWQVALLIHIINLSAMVWGKQKGLF
jgi:hypothetical protein